MNLKINSSLASSVFPLALHDEVVVLIAPHREAVPEEADLGSRRDGVVGGDVDPGGVDGEGGRVARVNLLVDDATIDKRGHRPSGRLLIGEVERDERRPARRSTTPGAREILPVHGHAGKAEAFAGVRVDLEPVVDLGRRQLDFGRACRDRNEFAGSSIPESR